MEIKKTQDGAALTVELIGRLDTTTSPELEAEFNKILDGVEELYLDLKQLDYISSSGLRVLLTTQKRMNKQGKMVLRNLNEFVMEVLEATGFVEILTIEE